MRSLYLLNHDPQMEFIQLSIQLLRSVILLDIFPPKYLSSYNDGCTSLSQWLYLILLNSLLVDVRNQQEGREACYCCLGYSASCVESALISDSRLEFFFFLEYHIYDGPYYWKEPQVLASKRHLCFNSHSLRLSLLPTSFERCSKAKSLMIC